MASSTKVEEDMLLERIRDTMIKEERIPKTKLSFPFVLNKLCVMTIMINN
jgi:hypothetical protein